MTRTDRFPEIIEAMNEEKEKDCQKNRMFIILMYE